MLQIVSKGVKLCFVDPNSLGKTAAPDFAKKAVLHCVLGQVAPDRDAASFFGDVVPSKIQFMNASSVHGHDEFVTREV